MNSTRFISLLGLAFGDCGKGLFTDYLCRHWQAHTVVRFNGGAQAGHNVVLPDGRHHTFSQFGAATFVPDVVTLLAYPVVVHPTALLIENEFLQRAGVADGLQRLMIDARCRVTTPFHQAAGRLRELARGQGAHGTCGVGVGETVRHSLDHPGQILRYADLLNPILALDKLEVIRTTLLRELENIAAPAPSHVQMQQAFATEWQVLNDASISRRWLERVGALTLQVVPAQQPLIAQRLHLPGTVIFEGAQGILLDEWRGFHPHTTWSSIHPSAVEAVLADAGQTAMVQHFGVLRSYLTRHGCGPLPTWDASLDSLPEPHNGSDGWQGKFRRGHPDAILLRYAMAVAGKLDGLLVSHLDVFDRLPGLRWCQGYEIAPTDATDATLVRDSTTGLVTGLRHGLMGDLGHQAALTQSLFKAQPRYEAGLITIPRAFLARLESMANLPVYCGAFGPTFESVVQF
ncbi:MAG: adenylosuccinate synthetase [Pseudomonadota bacterium]